MLNWCILAVDLAYTGSMRASLNQCSCWKADSLLHVICLGAGFDIVPNSYMKMMKSVPDIPTLPIQRTHFRVSKSRDPLIGPCTIFANDRIKHPKIHLRLHLLLGRIVGKMEKGKKLYIFLITWRPFLFLIVNKWQTVLWSKLWQINYNKNWTKINLN